MKTTDITATLALIGVIGLAFHAFKAGGSSEKQPVLKDAIVAFESVACPTGTLLVENLVIFIQEKLQRHLPRPERMTKNIGGLEHILILLRRLKIYTYHHIMLSHSVKLKLDSFSA